MFIDVSGQIGPRQEREITTESRQIHCGAGEGQGLREAALSQRKPEWKHAAVKTATEARLNWP